MHFRIVRSCLMYLFLCQTALLLVFATMTTMQLNLSVKQPKTESNTTDTDVGPSYGSKKSAVILLWESREEYYLTESQTYILFALVVLVVTFTLTGCAIFVMFWYRNEAIYQWMRDPNAKMCAEMALNEPPPSAYYRFSRSDYRECRLKGPASCSIVVSIAVFMDTVLLLLKCVVLFDAFQIMAEIGNFFLNVVIAVALFVSARRLGLKNIKNDRNFKFDLLVTVITFANYFYCYLSPKSSGIVPLFALFLFRALTLVDCSFFEQKLGVTSRKCVWLFKCTFQDFRYLLYIYTVLACFRFFGIAVHYAFQSAFDQPAAMFCSHFTALVISLYRFLTSGFNQFLLLFAFLMSSMFASEMMGDWEFYKTDASILTLFQLRRFAFYWARYDVGSKGKMAHGEVFKMLSEIPEPVGFGKYCTHQAACKKMSALRIPVDSEGCVTYNAVMFAIVRKHFQIFEGHNLFTSTLVLRGEIGRVWPFIPKTVYTEVVPAIKETGDTSVTTYKIYAAIRIQNCYRQCQERRALTGCLRTDLNKRLPKPSVPETIVQTPPQNMPAVTTQKPEDKNKETVIEMTEIEVTPTVTPQAPKEEPKVIDLPQEETETAETSKLLDSNEEVVHVMEIPTTVTKKLEDSEDEDSSENDEDEEDDDDVEDEEDVENKEDVEDDDDNEDDSEDDDEIIHEISSPVPTTSSQQNIERNQSRASSTFHDEEMGYTVVRRDADSRASRDVEESRPLRNAESVISINSWSQ